MRFWVPSLRLRWQRDLPLFCRTSWRWCSIIIIDHWSYMYMYIRFNWSYYQVAFNRRSIISFLGYVLLWFFLVLIKLSISAMLTNQICSSYKYWFFVLFNVMHHFRASCPFYPAITSDAASSDCVKQLKYTTSHPHGVEAPIPLRLSRTVTHCCSPTNRRPSTLFLLRCFFFFFRSFVTSQELRHSMRLMYAY